MTQPAPTPSAPSLEELRRLMHLDWADGAVDGGPPLADTDRAADLYGLVASPYHQLAFGNLNFRHLMLISIYHLMENRQWSQVWRAVAQLHRMERDHERKREVARPKPAHNPVIGASDTAPELHTTPAPPPAPPPKPKPASRPAHPTQPAKTQTPTHAAHVVPAPTHAPFT